MAYVHELLALHAPFAYVHMCFEHVGARIFPHNIC